MIRVDIEIYVFLQGRGQSSAGERGYADVYLKISVGNVAFELTFESLQKQRRTIFINNTIPVRIKVEVSKYSNHFFNEIYTFLK